MFKKEAGRGNDALPVGAAIGRPPVLFGAESRTSDARPYGSDGVRRGNEPLSQLRCQLPLRRGAGSKDG